MTAPAPVPALPDAERRTAYSIAAQAGPFAVNFAVYGDGADYVEWIEVWLNGVQLAPGTWALTSPSGSIGTLARPITDAVVSLGSAGTGTLEIVGARRPRRTSQFAENQGVTARDLNQVFTDVIAQMREGWDRMRTRMFAVPAGETTSQLPIASSRANKLFGFDGGGNPAMQSWSQFFIAGTSSAFDVMQFGARGDGVTLDTAAFQAAISTCAAYGGGSVTVPAKTFIIGDSQINLAPNVTLQGASETGTILKVASSFSGIPINGSFASGAGVKDLTIDCGDFPAVFIGLGFLLSDDIAVERVNVTKIGQFGISINGSNRFRIADCKVSKTTASPHSNQGILIAASNAALDGEITRNVLLNTGMDVCAARTSITKNRISNWGYGAGITTEVNVLCHELFIDGNECRQGTGIDENATICGGIENWAKWSILSNNICISNDGTGIDHGGLQSIVIGNICLNNSQFGAGLTNGITARYIDASFNASGTVFIGNKSFNTGGVTGTQNYGYAEESALLTEISLSGNNFLVNRTGTVNILSDFTAIDVPVRKILNWDVGLTIDTTIGGLTFNRGSTSTITLPVASQWQARRLHLKTITAQLVVSASSNVKPIDSDTAGTAILPATAGAWCEIESDGSFWITMKRGT